MEIARVKTYNIKLAVYIVRRRLRHWTQAGFPAVILGDDTLFGRFEKLVLARASLAKWVAIGAGVQTTVDAQNIEAEQHQY